MKRLFLRLLFLTILTTTANNALHAEIIVLKSGQRMQGTILVHNHDVVILRNAAGERFQFPANDIQDILPDEQHIEQEAVTPTEKIKKNQHPVALRIVLGGGAAVIPNRHAGGSADAEFRIGTSDLAARRIFLGGSIGWHGAFFGNSTATDIPTDDTRAVISGLIHFIPLQAVVSVPLLQSTHAPEIGMSLGYGFATGGNKGGMTGGLELSWRWQARPKTAFLLGWHAQFQQTSVTLNETLNGSPYSRTTGAVCILTGARLALQF